MLTLTQRIEAGADRGHALTFVVGGDHVAVPYAPAPRGGPRLRRQPPGPGRRPRRPRRPPRAHHPAAGHRHPGRLAGRRHGRRAARCRCASARSRSSSPRPGCGSATPTSSLRARRPRPGAVHRARRPATRRWSAGTPCSPAPAGPTAAACERPADDLDALAILQFTSGSTSDPKGVMLPHRTVGANLDAIARGHVARPRRRRARVVAAAVPRHGPGRAVHPRR